MLPDLFVIRHGETEFNAIGRMQGGLDSRLTANGRDQADAMANKLRGIVGPDTHDLICSPQGRALATADPISAATGCPIVPIDDLREISMGDWTGLPRAEIDRRWPVPNPNEHFVEFYARAPNGEPFENLWNRVGRVLDGLTRPTVIVTHGFTSRFLRTRAMGWGMDRIADLPGKQGAIFQISNGQHKEF